MRRGARPWRIDWRPARGGWWHQWPGDYVTARAAIRVADKELRGLARAVRVINVTTGEVRVRRGGAWFIRPPVAARQAGWAA